MENLLTVKDVQDRLKLGKNNTYKLVNKKGFPKITIGKKILIPEEQFEKYIMNHMRSKIELD
jgi:excisionase family DNA binding protein